MKIWHWFLIIGGALIVIFALRGNDRNRKAAVNTKRFEKSFLAMGTRGNLIIEIPAARLGEIEKIQDAVTANIEKIENLLSRFRESSDVARFNAAATNDFIAVNPLTWRALMESQRVYELSRGAFDITILPLLKLYDFRNAETPIFPTPDEIAAAQALVGMDKIVFARDGMRIAKTVAGLEIDLGGVAKGLAVDIAADTLAAFQIKNAIIDIGGEQRLLGKPLRENPLATAQTATATNPENDLSAEWQTGIRDPRRPYELARVLAVRSGSALATSGDYEKFFFRDGKRFSHILDPHSGLPITGGIISATVLTPDNCALADALATAVSVLGFADENIAEDVSSEVADQDSGAVFTARELLKQFPQVIAWLILEDGSIRYISSENEWRE